jgi:hypothetical protein
MTTPNIFSIITAFIFLTQKNVYHFTCTEQAVPGDSTTVGPQAWNLLHVTLLAPRMEMVSRFVQNLWTPAAYDLKVHIFFVVTIQTRQAKYVQT